MTALSADAKPVRGSLGFPTTASQGGTSVTDPSTGSLVGLGNGGVFTGYPVADNVTIYKGAIVALNAAGYAVPAISSASPVVVVGVSEIHADNTALHHAASALCVNATLGVWRMFQTGTTITTAYVGSAVYAADDNTVSLSASAGPYCGTVVDVDSIGVWVNFTGPATPALGVSIKNTTLAGTSAVGSYGGVFQIVAPLATSGATGTADAPYIGKLPVKAILTS
jgi:hypothetical protein